jgi:hypothetical protein
MITEIVLALLVSGSSARAEPLQVTVYDNALLTKEVREAAFDGLRRIFRQSGIALQLVEGDLSAPEASLVIYPATPRPGHEQEAACRARRDIALLIVPAAPSGLAKAVLGIAQPLAGEGVNVRIFDDRIRGAALRENRAYAAVLSHAIAHEIGHVLLRSGAHSGRGLMSGVWTAFEYGWMANGLMFFADDEARKMQMNMDGSSCRDMPEVMAAAHARDSVPDSPILFQGPPPNSILNR